MANTHLTPHQLLKQVGATLVRSKRHEIWKLPNGRIVVVSKSASDHRSSRNCVGDIYKQLKVS